MEKDGMEKRRKDGLEWVGKSKGVWIRYDVFWVGGVGRDMRVFCVGERRRREELEFCDKSLGFVLNLQH